MDYETIALVSLGAMYLAQDIYFDSRRRKIVNEFVNFTNNYVVPKAKEMQASINKLNESINNLGNNSRGLAKKLK